MQTLARNNNMSSLFAFDLGHPADLSTDAVFRRSETRRISTP